MPQEINLNVAPYFDDFNAKDNYCKILFKPGLPVQARELTGIQSVLQNQIEKFGQHIFKDGSLLVEETDYGRVIYLTKEGQIIWEFNNIFEEQNYRIGWGRVVEEKKLIDSILLSLENKNCPTKK